MSEKLIRTASTLQHWKVNPVPPTHAEIAEAAYYIWLTTRREPGRDRRNWRWAEQQLRLQRAVAV